MNLTILRKNKNVSQKELAEFLQMSQTAISHFETGRNEPDLKTVIKLADFFNCSTDYLLGRRTSLSEIKQQLINIISNLDDDLCSLAEAYIEGLKTTQKQRDMVRARVSQQNNIEEDID